MENVISCMKPQTRRAEPGPHRSYTELAGQERFTF